VLTGTGQTAELSGKPIPESFSGVAGLKNDGELHQIKNGDTKYNAMRCQLLWNLNIMARIPELDITKPLDNLIFVIVLQMLLVLPAALLISAFVSSFFTRPIVRLAKNMHQINSEEQLVELKPKRFRDDEISDLYISYNSLIRRIHQLMSDIKTTMTLQKKSELKALQAQINPHFIYNSLDTVNCMALYEGRKDICTIVTSLIDIFRYSIKDPDTMVTLEEEIDHLTKYLQIQDMRYAGKFVFKMEVSDGYLQYLLPKLTIQPLVENSLFHAINSRDVMSIRLLIDNTESGFIILVSDTGKLADPESINEYLRGSDNLKSSGEGIGIRNLNRRIKMYFGDDFGLHYERTEDGLTAVLILPPMQ
jgi:two-component system sensor histidine kinase YesM